MKKLLLVLNFLLGTVAFAQEIEITGTVNDKSGPLPGVNISVKGTTKRTETDLDGKYKIKANKGAILVFKYVGMKSVERIVKESTVINVVMKAEALLEEIVLTGHVKRERGKAVMYDKSYGVRVSRNKEFKGKPQSGQLTAGEVNDIEKWKEWLNLRQNQEFNKVCKDWDFNLFRKIETTVKDCKGNPIVNADVFVYKGNLLVFKSKTDVFGKVIVFAKKKDKLKLEIHYKGETKTIKLKKRAKKVEFTIGTTSSKSPNVDIMFTVDTTGSMADELEYLKSEIETIINRINKKIKQKRVGLVFYRDEGDDYIVRDFDFTTNIKKVKQNLSEQHADGGGDFPEAVEQALKFSLSKSWDENASAKLMFLLLDAPPHHTKQNVKIIKEQIKKAQEKGIKIIPIISSGANKSTEFLMRNFSVTTNGTTVFLTDDSGIGNKHIKPSTKDMKVERLDNLIVRLIEKYAGINNKN